MRQKSAPLQVVIPMRLCVCLAAALRAHVPRLALAAHQRCAYVRLRQIGRAASAAPQRPAPQRQLTESLWRLLEPAVLIGTCRRVCLTQRELFLHRIAQWRRQGTAFLACAGGKCVCARRSAVQAALLHQTCSAGLTRCADLLPCGRCRDVLHGSKTRWRKHAEAHVALCACSA